LNAASKASKVVSAVHILGTLVIFPLHLIACLPPHAEDDGFRAKLAAGCRSSEECSALREEGEHRYKACTDRAIAAGRVDLAECNDALRQRRESGQMLTARSEADEKARWAQIHADRKQDDDERVKFEADRNRFADSCTDLAELEKAASAAKKPNVASRYRATISERRASSVRKIVQSLEWRTGRAPKVEVGRDEIAAARKSVEDLRCFDEDAAIKAKATVDAWATGVEKAVADEDACQASAACMGARAAVPVCNAIRDRRTYVNEIAQERRNPGGVVDLNALHDLGQRIQDIDAGLPGLKADYKAAAHKPFGEALCVSGASR
jgi:hypothetical protein